MPGQKVQEETRGNGVGTNTYKSVLTVILGSQGLRVEIEHNTMMSREYEESALSSDYHDFQ